MIHKKGRGGGGGGGGVCGGVGGGGGGGGGGVGGREILVCFNMYYVLYVHIHSLSFILFDGFKVLLFMFWF